MIHNNVLDGESDLLRSLFIASLRSRNARGGQELLILRHGTRGTDHPSLFTEHCSPATVHWLLPSQRSFGMPAMSWDIFGFRRSAAILASSAAAK